MLCASPPKKDKELRFCVEHRVLNKKIVRSNFLISHTDVQIDKPQGSRIFSILDLWSAYQQVRTHPPDIPKTVFVSPFGHFAYLVVSLWSHERSIYIPKAVVIPRICEFLLIQ